MRNSQKRGFLDGFVCKGVVEFFLWKGCEFVSKWDCILENEVQCLIIFFVSF